MEGEAAVLHHADTLSPAGHGAVVRYQHHGQATFPPHGLKQANDLVSRVLVEVAGRFVGQQDLGLLDQGAGDGDPLLLAAGQLAGDVPQPVPEADGLQGDRGLREDGGAVTRPGSETPRQIRAWPRYLNES
jgi:hypothetical protein